MNDLDAGHTKILYLSRVDVQAVCDEIDPVALVQEVFRTDGYGQSILPDEAYLDWRNRHNDAVRSLNMPGYLGGGFCIGGTKIINSNPANSARGLPRASGLTLLFDPETARIRCIMEASHISALRTAAVSMLAVRFLACANVRSLCIIGTGVIGTAHLKLAASTIPTLERVILFDVNPPAARAAATNALPRRADRPIEIELARSPETAVQSADVVVAATTATVGYIRHDWLRPGAVAINVSLDDFLPEVFLKADLLFVDDWKLVQADSRRLLGRLCREGKIVGPEETIVQSNARRVDGELADLVLRRHPGRRTAEEIILVNPFGLAIEDIGFASRVFDIARSRGLGMYVNV